MLIPNISDRENTNSKAVESYKSVLPSAVITKRLCTLLGSYAVAEVSTSNVDIFFVPANVSAGNAPSPLSSLSIAVST